MKVTYYSIYLFISFINLLGFHKMYFDHMQVSILKFYFAEMIAQTFA